MRFRTLLLAISLAVLVAACGGDDDAPGTSDAVTSPQAESSPESSNAPVQAEPTATLLPEPTATPTPPGLVVSDGDRIIIEKLSVDAPLVLLKVGPDGVMPESGPDRVGIYDFSEWPGLGGVPGEGNLVVAGNNGRLEAPGIFRFFSLAEGDVVELTLQGETLSYTVVALCLGTLGEFDAILAAGDFETLTVIQGSGGDNRAYALAERIQGSLPGTCPAGSAITQSPNDIPE